jgi:NADPH:quinone reductase-like Zn-dependent oxidoreductase
MQQSLDNHVDTDPPARTMRAIVQEAWGTNPDTTLALREVDRPTVGDAEVLVNVVAASVDRGTVHCMTGQPYAMRLMGFGVRSPKAPNPGRALAGVVTAVGRDVAGFAPGDEVYGTCAGSFAEFAPAKPDMLARKPGNLSFEQAAAAPISGVTALQAVRQAGIGSGSEVLVIGASGGVGTFAVQIAKGLGAVVTGVCSTEKVELVRSIGADHVIDYRREPITSGGRRYDAILDIGGNTKLSELRRALNERGVLVIVGGETGGRWLGGFDRSLRAVLLSPFVRQSLGMLTSKENSDDLDALRELIESDVVAPTVDRTYPLSETAVAIRELRDGVTRGKAVITV